ncbi:MAG TPA: LysR family transcriptional regulator [Acetobacteraceae bacterium]|nr:LysR family transcriptional regulator [Acetobacteraceae bacterium]
MDMLAAFRVFARVAECGSFSAVAREIGATQPAVSRQVAALEDHLDTRLIQRTTRSLTLTQDGQDLLAHIRGVLERVDESLEAVGRNRGAVSGLVRIGSTQTFGRRYLMPHMPALLEHYPGLSVNLTLNDERQDLIAAGLDLVVRIGTIADSSLVARRIGSVATLIVASEDYLARRGEPRHPAELAHHECIIYDRFSDAHEWHLAGPDGPIAVIVQGRFSTNSMEAVREAVLRGMGIGIFPAYMGPDTVGSVGGRAASLRTILQPWQTKRTPLHAVYPSRRHLAPRTRAVIDFLIAAYRHDPIVADPELAIPVANG